MAFTITGKLEKISDVKSIPSKNGGDPFLTRSIQLGVFRYDSVTGEIVERDTQHIVFDLNGKATEVANPFKVGNVVTVTFVIEGVLFTNAQNEERQFNRLRAFKIEPYVSRAQAFERSVQKAEYVPQAQAEVPNQPDDLPF